MCTYPESSRNSFKVSMTSSVAAATKLSAIEMKSVELSSVFFWPNQRDKSVLWQGKSMTIFNVEFVLRIEIERSLQLREQ